MMTCVNNFNLSYKKPNHVVWKGSKKCGQQKNVPPLLQNMDVIQ